MNKVMEKILTDASVRNPHAVKSIALSQAEFTPWEGGE
jgi:hypothetical protein